MPQTPKPQTKRYSLDLQHLKSSPTELRTMQFLEPSECAFSRNVSFGNLSTTLDPQTLHPNTLSSEARLFSLPRMQRSCQTDLKADDASDQCA